MSHISNAANDGLLAYGVTTNPDPIQASPVLGNPALASIVITVSNNTDGAIYCNKLIFSFPIGALAQDLTSTTTGILVSANPSAKWQISMTSDGVFTATPITPKDSEITTDGLSFQIYNIQANQQVGTFTFTVEENTSTNNINFTKKASNFNLAKFPYGFYVNNFSASAPMVQDGATVTLKWSGSDLGSYTILYGTQTVDVTDIRIWTSPAITETTTFSLRASVQLQGETVDNYLYITVIVANPELTVTSLNVKTNATIDNELRINGPASPGTSLSLGGIGEFAVDSDGTTAGRFVVKTGGNVGIANANPSETLSVGGSLGVTGNASLEGATALAQATVASLISSGTVNMLGAAQAIAAGSYTAPTDGFVIANVFTQGASNFYNAQSIGWASCSSNGITMQATGGNILYWMSWPAESVWSATNPNSFTMPIQKGAYFTTNAQIPSGNGNLNPPTITFYWVPIGIGSVSMLSDKEIEELGEQLPLMTEVPSHGETKLN